MKNNIKQIQKTIRIKIKNTKRQKNINNNIKKQHKTIRMKTEKI